MIEGSLPISPSADPSSLWSTCVDQLAQEIPEQQFNTWIRPLSAVVAPDQSKVVLAVANRFKLDWIRTQYAARIAALLEAHLALMRSISPPESVHALDSEKLRQPTITFWSAWEEGQLLGCVALKQHDAMLGEIKRTPRRTL